MFATTTATVAAPIEKVWAVVADHEGMANWGPGKGLKVELLQAGTTERNGVGAVRKISPAGPGPSIVEKVTVFDAPNRLQYTAVSGVPLKGYFGDIELKQTDAGTEIVYKISATERVPFVEKLACKSISAVLLALLVKQVKRES